MLAPLSSCQSLKNDQADCPPAAVNGGWGLVALLLTSVRTAVPSHQAGGIVIRGNFVASGVLHSVL